MLYHAVISYGYDDILHTVNSQCNTDFSTSIGAAVMSLISSTDVIDGQRGNCARTTDGSVFHLSTVIQGRTCPDEVNIVL